MDGLQFISTIVGTLIWPLVIVVCVFLFRHQLGSLLHRVSEFEAPGGIKATFGTLSKVEKVVAEVTSEALPVSGARAGARTRDDEWTGLLERVYFSPRDAVLGAWSNLEHQLNLVSEQVDPSCPRGWPHVEGTLRSLDQWPALRPAVAELWHLRNTTAHSLREPDRVDATRYVSVARELVIALDGMTSTPQTDRPGAEVHDDQR